MNWGNIKYISENQEIIRHFFSDTFQSQLEAARRIEQAEKIHARIRGSTPLSRIVNDQEFFHGLNGTKNLFPDLETFKRASENQENLKQIIRKWGITGNLKRIWDEKWNSLLSTVEELQEKLEPFKFFLSESTSIHSGIARKLATDFSGLTFQLGNFSESFFEYYRLNSIDFEDLKRFSNELREIQLRINEDGSVTIEDQTVIPGKIEGEINNILKKEEGDEAQLSNFINRLVQTANISRNSWIKVIVGIVIYSILFPLIANLISHFINPVVEKEVKRLIEKNPKNITITLNKHNFSEIAFLSESRFVVAVRLNVRYKPYRKSRMIGKLEHGDVVKVLRIKKDWTLVHYEDQENSVSIQGWVFSRYLKKFRNRYPQYY